MCVCVCVWVEEENGGVQEMVGDRKKERRAERKN